MDESDIRRDGVAVEASELRKSYGPFEAVAGVSFTVERGTCFGFLGPNGAGKTSVMRMIQAVSPATAGSISVLGRDPLTDGKEVRARIGVVPQEDNLDPELTVLQNLELYAGYFAIGQREARRRAEELLEFVSLAEKGHRPIRELSGGMKRRLIIARALVNDPELVILDEPTTGLDPQARHVIWQKLRELKTRGVTMVLTTHYMDEAERLCDELVIMDEGKILAQGSPAGLIRTHAAEDILELRLEAELEAAVFAGISFDEVQTERVGDVRLFFLSRQSAIGEDLLQRARDTDVPWRLRNATLEDVFLRLAGRELSE